MRIGASTNWSEGRKPGLEPGEIDERLEGRTRLALRLRRPIELAPAVIAAADHGAHRAIGRHRHERPLADRRLGTVACDGLGDGRLGFGLQDGIERRRDGEVASAGAGKIAELLGDPIGEIAGTRSGGGDDGARRPLFGGSSRLGSR